MRVLSVALLAAGAHASTGGKPRSDLPPLFLVPSLCGSRMRANVDYSKTHYATGQSLPYGTFLAAACAGIVTLAAMGASFYLAWHEEHKEKEFREDMRKMSSKIHSEDSDRRESRVMTTSTNSVLIGGAGPGAPMAPAVAVKPMSVDEKNRAIRARAVAEAKK